MTALDRFQAESIDEDLVRADTHAAAPGYCDCDHCRAERNVRRLIELRAAKADVRQLQGALADARRRIEALELALAPWAPLLAQYEHEMAGRRARPPQVPVIDTLEQWVADIVRSRRGVVVDDGAGADWARRRA